MHSIGRMAERKRRGELADKRSVASSVGGAVALQPIAEGQRLLAPERGAVDDARRRRCEVGSSVALCLGTIGFVPVVNKQILAADGPLRAAPLSMTAVQLAGAFVVFATLTLCQYARRGPPGKRALRRRARRLLPLGLAFGLKVGASNVGLGLVSTELHVLLGATEVVWTALFAFFVDGERPSAGGAAALVGCAAGAALAAGAPSAGGPQPTPFGVAANLVAPCLQGLVVGLLRRGARVELVAGRASYVEFTALKLGFAVAAAAPLAVLREGAGPVVAAAAAAGRETRVAAATLLTAAVQLSFTALASVASANTVGIVAAAKVVPQWLLAAAAAPEAAASPGHVLGAGVLAASAALWAATGNAPRRAAPPRRTLYDAALRPGR